MEDTEKAQVMKMMLLIALGPLALGPLAFADEPRPAGRRPLTAFERVVIDDQFPGAYQVEVADVNADGKPDVVAVGGGTCAWYENPHWTKRVITGSDRTPGVISSATADYDGDGKAEVAIAYEFAMNEPTRGKLGLATPGAAIDDPWAFRHLADIGSIHRLRAGDFEGTGRPQLAIAPIFGPEAKPPAFDQDGAALRFARPIAGDRAGAWRWSTARGTVKIAHAIDATDVDGDGRPDLLIANLAGVTSTTFQPELRDEWPLTTIKTDDTRPTRGASEVHIGRLADGRRFVVTIEPWHGREVVVRHVLPPEARSGGPPLIMSAPRLSTRDVIDDSLDAGHALWVADVDGDGDDEIFAGHRGKDHRVAAYDFDGKTWARTVIDPDVAAQDLRGGDLDGDGVPDVVAVGGQTHNVLWYRPRTAGSRR